MKDYKYIQDRRTGEKHRILGVVDDTLTEEGIAADAKVVGDALATKAEVDGAYDSMTVGNAEQLISTVYEEDSVPYQFRTSGGSIDIGDREEDTIIGGTVAWNQIIKNGNFADGTTGWSGSVASISASNGELTVTKNGNTGEGVGYARQPGVSLIVGHKYLYTCDYKGITGKRLVLFTNSANSGMTTVIPTDENWHTKAVVFNVLSLPSVSAIFWLNYATTTGDNVAQFRNICYFDLTQMFGSTIADYIYTLEQTTSGAGVAWFRKLFPKPYYAYNPGELLSVSGLQSHDMVGFNQWDEEWELGSINSTTGQPVALSTAIRCKNFIPVLPNTAYCYHNGSEIDQAPWFYDAEKNFVNRSSSYISTGGVFTIPDNVRYMKFALPATYGTTYKNDICINLHWDGERDGEYEPYKKWSYPLDDSLTLRGIPKLDADNKLYYDGDVYESDGTVTRKYGIVDLGTLDWIYSTTGVYYYTIGLNTSDSKKAKYRGQTVSGLYKNRIFSDNPPEDLLVCIANSNAVPILRIANFSYTDAAAFKAAMSGVYLVYELAEPTTESADPYQNPQIVDDFGTEEYVTTSIVPVGHETKYQPNLRAKLEMAPNSPDGNGDYIVRHTNGENVYVPLSFPADELPSAPTENGTYRLTVTVSNGTATYAWVSA